MDPKALSASRKSFPLDAALTESLLARALSSGQLPASGELSASALPRLAGSVLAIDGPVVWQFAPQASRGGALHATVAARAAPKRWWLEVRAQLVCSCERCLSPVTISVHGRRAFEFYATASLADRRARQLEESGTPDPDADHLDLVALEEGASLLALMEDELLLELPMAPKHETCPLPS